MIAPVRSLGLLCLLGALPLLACSGASSTSAAATSTSTDQAPVASSLNEPRTQDPTAATAAQVSTGGNVPAGKPPAGKPAKASPSPSTSEDMASGTAAEVRPPSKVGARHVLVQWMGADRAGKSVLRSREQALVLIQEVQRRAKAGEDLGRLAAEYSDEPNAGDRRGSLGRFGRGQMVPAFDAAVFKLKVGEISEIVETPFGFHIIQRTE